jgi:hypothetical protein
MSIILSEIHKVVKKDYLGYIISGDICTYLIVYNKKKPSTIIVKSPDMGIRIASLNDDDIENYNNEINSVLEKNQVKKCGIEKVMEIFFK